MVVIVSIHTLVSIVISAIAVVLMVDSLTPQTPDVTVSACLLGLVLNVKHVA